MNPDTTVSAKQIRAIFTKHGLAEDPTMKRITIGFTNEIHQVNNYILKVYVRPEGEKNFEKESNFYKSLHDTVLVPKLIVADKSRSIIHKPFIIYEMIEGEPLGKLWHLLNNNQRKEIIHSACNQLMIIRSSQSMLQLESGKTWQEQIISTINRYLDAARDKQLLSTEVTANISNFITTNQYVLEKEILGLTYWDLHLDNLIVNQAGMLVGLVDFEHVDVVSIDYLLNIIRQMVRHPHLTLSQEMEVHAKGEDYRYLLDWFQEFYPELFDFRDLDRRIDLYELEGLLRLLPRFPNAQQIHDRLHMMLGQP